MKKQFKRCRTGGEIFKIDSKHYKYHAAKSRANKIRWGGNKARIKSTNNGHVVYKGSRRIRRRR